MKFYNAYEMRIGSDLEIPELLIWPGGSKAQAELDIVEGVIPQQLKESLPQVGPFLFADKDDLLLNVPDIASYWVRSGKRIIYQKCQGCSDDDLRTFLLGSCFGAVLIQRDYLVLHGSTIQVGDGCIVCVGESTAGKSTLAAAFMQSGFSILSDDVCAVDHSGKAMGGISRVKINQDMARSLGIDTSGLNTIRANCDSKFSLPLGEQFCSRKLPVLAVYELSGERKDVMIYSGLNRLESFSILSQHLYRPRYIKAMQKTKTSFYRCSELVKSIHVSRITRPADQFSVNQLRDMIIDDLQRLNIAES